MKALITAGGRGTRLRPLTHTQNKHLIPIANKPILHHAIEFVAAAGLTEVGIVVNAGDHEVQAAIGDGSRWGIAITYIPQEAPLGLAHVVKIAHDFIGDDRFVFYLGDNMIVGGISRFIEAFQAAGSSCHLALARVPDPERFGVPEIRGDRIVGVEEKPAIPKSTYAVTGIYLYDSAIFEAVNDIQPSARGELEISDAHQWLLDHGHEVSYSEITGWWKDTGKPSDLLEANRLVLDAAVPRLEGEVDAASHLLGRVVLEAGARIQGSVVRGPAIIGKDSVIENSYVGPFSAIGEGCTIRNSEVEYSILVSRCKVIDVQLRIEGSLLGHDVEIVHSTGLPRTHRFMIGDQSRVEIT
jgi:glucose-1-phosphate thymidylyltransferase